MHLHRGAVSASPTDLANFLTCRHKTSLDRLAAEGQIERPAIDDPFADILRQRGIDHERRYVRTLGGEGLSVVDLTDAGDAPRATSRETREARTLAAMHAGADVIVQAALSGHARWFGYADVLRRVDVPSSVLGAWSYEVHDTKLSRETRGGTVLQLCLYSDLLSVLQGRTPEYFHVVTPRGREAYRMDDFAAFYRRVQERFGDDIWGPPLLRAATYPDPVEHCVVCRWARRCTAERRRDDHVSFVAGLGRQQQTELARHGVTTLAGVAALDVPLPFKPRKGVRDTFERLREQARLQLQARQTREPVFELLPIEKDFGLCRLPKPRAGDLFLDLEGDPFGRVGGGFDPGESGREYLFGLVRQPAAGSNAAAYCARWATSDEEERAAFQGVMAEIMAAVEADPDVHVYHYAAYEASAFRRLACRYATCEADLDRLLRGGRFVDLYAVARHALRAGVEHYSIKNLEPFFGFSRDVDLRAAAHHRRLIEIALESGDTALIAGPAKDAVEGYNRDDCRSTLELRRWLETLRAERIAAGADIPRPPRTPDAPSDTVRQRDRQFAALRGNLLGGVPADRAARTAGQEARYLMAYLIDWYRREERVAWGEFHRVREQSSEELMDEPSALVGLRFVERVVTPSGRRTTVVDRYDYPPQENDIRGGDLHLQNARKFGTVSAVDRDARTIDVKKTVEQTDVHPDVVINVSIVGTPEQEASICRTATAIADHGLDSAAADRLVRDLLLGRPPRMADGPVAREAGESATDFAVRIVSRQDAGVLPIQGPPGSGKTFTGAKMIAALAAMGRKVGVAATGHKVIRKLLDDADAAAGGSIPMAHKDGESSPPAPDSRIERLEGNPQAAAWLARDGGRVLGATAWLWARPEFAKSVDVLFVDEAGQISLADVVSIAPAAAGMVLLGDPRQLEQPRRGAHPDGVNVSALDHMLGGHKTMPEDRGIFLPVTWRLNPEICAFTSEMFYESRLVPKPGLERQRLRSAGRFTGAGLFLVDVAHDGCRNASLEEADAVCAVVRELCAPGAEWMDERGIGRQLTPADIVIVAPYNAHVVRVMERLSRETGLSGFRVGTVDKFQGQEAPVVIYTMATSRPEDAPRGMEFLYSLNRLNVATSRAKCACILVASPLLFEPDCQTPRQMQLANGLARYRERSRSASAMLVSE